MTNVSDIERIKKQEALLVLDRFDEAVAFEIGLALRAKALVDALPIVVEIQAFDRPLFFCALPGSDGSNRDWTRRKINVVKRYLRSSYRLLLENTAEDRLFKPCDGLDVRDYVLAGGGFPITVRGAGLIGVIAVSGLPDRDDHNLIVSILCDHLSVDPKSMELT